MKRAGNYKINMETVKKEAGETGFIVSAYQGPNAMYSEQSKPLRGVGFPDVMQAAWAWITSAFAQREAVNLDRFTRSHQGMILPTQEIFRPIANMPSHDTSVPWNNYALVHYDKPTHHIEEAYKTDEYYDQFGPAFNTPYESKPTGLYGLLAVGNPWNMGGKFFYKHNAYRNPDAAEHQKISFNQVYNKQHMPRRKKKSRTGY